MSASAREGTSGPGDSEVEADLLPRARLFSVAQRFSRVESGLSEVSDVIVKTLGDVCMTVEK